MRLFHNIFFRKFKSLPISYFKLGKELIEFSSFTGSVNQRVALITSSLFNNNLVTKSNQYLNLDSVIYQESDLRGISKNNNSLNNLNHFLFEKDISNNSNTLYNTDLFKNKLDTSIDQNKLSILSKDLLYLDTTNNNVSFNILSKDPLLLDTGDVNYALESTLIFPEQIDKSSTGLNLNNVSLNTVVFDFINLKPTSNKITVSEFVLFDVSNYYLKLNDTKLNLFSFDKTNFSINNKSIDVNPSLINELQFNINLNSLFVYPTLIDKITSTNILNNINLFQNKIDNINFSNKLNFIENKTVIIDNINLINKLNDLKINLIPFDINPSIENLKEINQKLEQFDFNDQNTNLNKISEYLPEIDNSFSVNKLNNIIEYLPELDVSFISEKLNSIDQFLTDFDNSIQSININNINKSVTNNDVFLFNYNLNNLLNKQTENEYVDQSKRINLLSLDFFKYPVETNIHLSDLNLQLVNEKLNQTFNLNKLNYDKTNEESSYINFNFNDLLLLNNLKDIVFYNTKFNKLDYSPSLFIDSINSNIINSNLNHKIINFDSIDIDIGFNLNYSLIDEFVNVLFNYSLSYNYVQSDNTNFTILPSVEYQFLSEKNELSKKFSQTSYYNSNLNESVTGSKTEFVPYDSSSNLTFNSSSLKRYVRQINEIFYISGSQLTSSRIDYQEDIELIVIGKGSTTTYKDNLDYNLPYRASFIVKNWPHYQYNTSSYWYLPVQLNASNDDILASGDIWVTASMQNGVDVFTDQYGFAIDI